MKGFECISKKQMDGRKIWYYRFTEQVPTAKPLVRVITGSNDLAAQMAERLANTGPTILVGPENPKVISCEVISNPWSIPEVWEWVAHRYRIGCVYHLALWDKWQDWPADRVFSSIVTEAVDLMRIIHASGNPAMIWVLPPSFAKGDSRIVEIAVKQLSQQVRLVAQEKNWPYALVHMPNDFIVTGSFSARVQDTSSPVNITPDFLAKACLLLEEKLSGDRLFPLEEEAHPLFSSSQSSQCADENGLKISEWMKRSEVFVPDRLD